MADPVTIGTLAAAALASGAAALGKEVVGTASKDAYAALKAALLPASPSNVEKLEANPEAEHRAISVAEDVDDLDADTQAKIEALEHKGVRVGRTPTQVAEIAVEILGG